MGSISAITIRDSTGAEKDVETFLSTSADHGQVLRRRMADTWAPSTAINVTTGATLLLASNVNRLKYVLYNDSDTTVYLSGTNAVTTANGIPLSAGQWWLDETYSGDVYAIHGGSGNKSVRVAEMTND
jgi:hypothetical protein